MSDNTASWNGVQIFVLLAGNFFECSSVSESKIVALLEKDHKDIIEHCQRQLVRVYPAATRLSSSNFNGLPILDAGCQIVALNYQDLNKNSDAYKAFFGDNGACGYVLKPQFMRTIIPGFDVGLFEASRRPWMLHVTIISGQRLPKPPASRHDVTDPYVTVEIVGRDYDEKKIRTSVVKNNGFILLIFLIDIIWRSTNFSHSDFISWIIMLGFFPHDWCMMSVLELIGWSFLDCLPGFNPVWKEKMEFKVRNAEMAILRIKVKDQDNSSLNPTIGQYSIPFICIQEGTYASIHLLFSLNCRVSCKILTLMNEAVIWYDDRFSTCGATGSSWSAVGNGLLVCGNNEMDGSISY